MIDEALRLTNEEGDYEGALRLWGTVLVGLHGNSSEATPDKAEIQLNVALCLSQLGRYEQALEPCEAAAEYYGEAFSDVSDEAQRAWALLVHDDVRRS